MSDYLKGWCFGYVTSFIVTNAIWLVTSAK